jgi:spermidine synthase
MGSWKKLFSYVIPIKEAEFRSKISGTLELTWEKGKLVLNSSNANLSFNHLHKVLRGAMEQAGLRKRSVFRVLNLGLGAGSSVHILRSEMKKNPFIRSIEIDPVIIQIADRFFDVNEDPKHDIILADAIEYLNQEKESYDLYIVDLFIDDIVHGEVMFVSFLRGLMHHAMPNATILINSMQNERSEGYKKRLTDAGIHFDIFSSKENEVYIFQGFN